MWGTWLNITLGVIGVALVLVAASVLASPLFAIVIAVVLLVAAIPIMSARRSSSERGSGLEGGVGGAPVSGEGSEAGEGAETAAHRAGERGSSRVSDGVWGERREA